MPPTGQRQAIEVHIKWREVLDFKRELLRMLSIGTGWSVEKLDAVRQRYRGRNWDGAGVSRAPYGLLNGHPC